MYIYIYIYIYIIIFVYIHIHINTYSETYKEKHAIYFDALPDWLVAAQKILGRMKYFGGIIIY
jgi:hypothetical protein